mgnify:CR=1 FL=1
MKYEYRPYAFQLFEFYLEDSSMLQFALKEFGRQPMMRNVVSDFITGMKFFNTYVFVFFNKKF